MERRKSILIFSNDNFEPINDSATIVGNDSVWRN
jgi:hypothetical protein